MKILRFLLFPFAIVMLLITEFRNFLFLCGILKQTQFNIPVISVGNISTGGTGKSPMVDYLLKNLASFNLATLSRGYGRKTNDFLEVLSTNSPLKVGDEPLMLKQMNESVNVFVDTNRVNGINSILQKYPHKNLIILDDAFQHRYVKPNLSILLSTYQNPFYNDYILPVGSLREMRKNVKRAQVIVITKCPVLSNSEIELITKNCKRYTNAKIYFSTLHYSTPVALFSNTEPPQNNTSVLLVTGIANSTSLEVHCKSTYKSIKQINFNDHHNYTFNDFATISQNFDSFASQNKIILTTQKDAVKWLDADEKSLEILKKLPIYYQPIQLQIQNNETEFIQLVQQYVRTTQPNS